MVRLKWRSLRFSLNLHQTNRAGSERSCVMLPAACSGSAHADAGVPVQTRRFDGMIHGFAQLTGVLDQATEFVRYASDLLRRAI